MIDQGTASANTLTAPAISLLTPSNTGIKLYAGQPYEVTWSYDGGVSNNIQLSYSTNGGASYLKSIAQSQANDGAYTWTTPYDLGTNMKVKVEETFYQKLLETSDGQFQSGTFANAQVAGSGTSASATLTNLFGVSPWTALTNAPGNVYYGGALTAVGSDTVYALQGNNSNGFWKYTISTNTWTSLAFTPANVSSGGELTAVGSDTIYAFPAGNSNVFWKYTISTNTWIGLASAPSNMSQGAALIAVGTDTIYVLRGNDTMDF